MAGRVSQLCGDEKFAIANWRLLLEKACRATAAGSHGIEIISPFGFEVLDNFRYSHNVRRFYCYLGIPKHVSAVLPRQSVENEFLDRLLQLLDEVDPIFLSQIALIKTSRGLQRLTEHHILDTDRFLYVKAREVDQGILSEYCDYTISIVGGICEGNHPQLLEFAVSPVARGYVFQRHIMLEHLLMEWMEPLDRSHSNRLMSLATSHVRASVSSVLVRSQPTIDEWRALYGIVLPRALTMRDVLGIAANESDDVLTLEANAFHGEARLRLRISQAKYLRLKSRISHSYVSFGALARVS